MNSRPGWKRIFGKLNSETLRETKDKFRLGADAMEGVTASPRSQTGISVPVAEALRESGKLFRLAFEHAPVAMAFVGTDFRFLKVNATFCRLFGYAEEELQSLTFVDLTHPEDVAKGVELSQQLARGEIPGFKLGKRYRTRSGETIWGEVTVAAVCDSDEPSLFGLVIIENITERKQAEEALRESEDRFRILADTAPVMVWMSGTDEFFDFFNLGWLAFTGRTPEQESGQGWFEGVHPDDVARCRQTCLAAFQAQEDFEMVHRLRRFDGEYRWVLNTGVPRFTPSGRFAGYIGSCLDITERQRTGEALRSALEFRERVMEAATNAIAVLDSEGKFILANCRAAEITGYTVEDLIGRSFHTLLPETELARVSEQVQATLTQCVQVLQFETEVLRKDGATRTISFSLEPLVLEGGQPGLVGTAEDITERKRAEASLLKEKRLSEATIASLPGVFYLFDETGKFLLWNQDLERVSGYSAAEIAQMHPLDLFAGDDRQLIAERIQEVFARGQATAEAHLIAKDGRQTPFYFTGRHVVLDHLSCLVGMGIDLTERRRAEAVLRESEDRNRDLIENSGVIIGMHDLEGNILSVNQSFVSVAGYERAEELLSLRISDLLADDVRRFFPVYLKKIRSKGYARGLMKIVTPGGEERTLEYDNSVRREGPSTPIVRCFARDVTERKRAVDALKESEVQLRTLGDNLPNGAIYQIVRKPDGRTYFQYISAGIERLLGVTAEEAMRDFCVVDDLLVVEEDRPRALAAINESIRSLSTFDIEVRSRTRQGQVKWIRFRSTPRRLPNGGTLCDGVMIDVTDVRRKLEALLQTVGAIIWEGWEGEEDTDARTFRFTFVSQQAVALLGYPVKDWLEQPTFWFDHLHPEDRRRVLTERRQAIAARRDYELEYRMMANDGRTVWLRGIVKVAYGNDQRLKLRGITVDVTEQKQAEAALRESEELFRTLAETTSAAIYIVRENRCVYANPTAEARSGYTRDELLAMDVWDLVHPEVRERAHERFQTLHKERLIPLHYETKGLAKSGQERWVEVSATPITFQGQPSLLVTTFDVTERKRAEDALRRSEARYRAIVEDQTELICRLQPDGTLTFVNQSYARYFSRTPEELIGTAFRPFIPAEEEERIEQFLASFSADNPVATIEHRVVLPSGEMRWQHWTDHAIYDEQRRLLEFQCVGRDITSQKRMEQALRQSQRRYALATAAGHVGLWDWNLETNDIYVDPELKALLGYRDEEIRNHMDDWSAHIHPEDRGAVMAAATDHIENRSPSYEIEHRMVHKDGAICWFIARGTLVKDEDGTRHIIGTKTEITERKRAEEALRQTEELNRAVLASLHHHIAVLDRDGRIIAVNEAWNRYAAGNGSTAFARIGPGVNYLEVCRKAVRESFLPAQRTLDGILSVLNGLSESYFEEYSCPYPSGVQWFLLSVTPLRRPEGGAVVSHIDISERKRAEEALRLSEEALRNSHSRIEYLAGRLIVAQEEERKHIARELHDDLNQQVAALAIGISRLKRQLPDADPAVHEQIARLQEKTDWLSERIRRISHQLHSSILQHVGLPAALKAYCSEFAEQEGIPVALDLQEELDAIPADAALCLYRVAQESLRNIARHSGAPSAEVKLGNRSGTLELRVADRGVGFDPKLCGGHQGLGLVSVEERVRLLHGNFQLNSRPGAGTELIVRIPLRSEP